MKINELKQFGISSSILERLVELGFTDLTEVQDLAVKSGLFERKNILVSAPTNTGKTFIGELAAISAATRRDFRRTFFLVPLKALAEEKYEDFRTKYSAWGLNVAISTSDRAEFDKNLLDYDVVIATYEKLMALMIRQPEILKEIGLVIVDELQNVSDPTRGPTVEMLLARLLLSPTRPQTIGLSATIPNAKDLAEWLEAALVQTNKRDVELREGVQYIGKDQVTFNGLTVRPKDFVYKEFNTGKVNVEPGLIFDTTEGIAETSKNEQFLVFTTTQRDAEEIARIITESVPKTTDTLEIIEELDTRLEPTPATRSLMRALQSGVAFHHAGLLSQERALIESGFRSGKIRIVCATTTLGAGVNTPAKNVVFRTHQTYEKRNIMIRDYKNMAGRAGRLRKDDFGRSVLFAGSEKELEMLWKEYVNSVPEQIVSQVPKGRKLDSLILGLIASAVCNDLDQIMYIIKMTFFGYTYFQKTPEQLRKPFEETIHREVSELEKKGLIMREDDKLNITELGRRCAEELISPSSVLLLYETLKTSSGTIKNTKDFARLTEGIVHLACNSPDVSESWALLFRPRQSEEDELQAYWEVNANSFLYQSKDPELFIRSLRTTRMLMRWLDGVPYSELAGYGRHGSIKRTAETISWVLRGLARVSGKPLFDFGDGFQENARVLAERVFYGVPANALPLMRLNIPLVSRNRAIQLTKAGFKSLDDLIDAPLSDLIRVPGIGDKTALAIKQSVERYIPDQITRSMHSQMRKAEQLGRSALHLKQLYEAKGEEFARACVEILKDIGLNAKFLGDTARIDGLVVLSQGNIALEGKRKEKDSVKAVEAEQVLGKAAEYHPVGHVTIGYPDFTEDAQKNSSQAKITLIRVALLGEILIAVWEGKLTKEGVVSILLSGKYVSDLSEYTKS